jgi:hypothetical protein
MLKQKKKYAPFGEAVPLFNSLPEREVHDLMENASTGGLTITANHPLMRPVVESIRVSLTKYGRYGVLTEDNAFNPALAFTEEAGAITRDKTPSFFDNIPKSEGTKEFTPDTAYMDVMRPLKMNDTKESMDEWDAHMTFVLMSEEGQVRYGKLATKSRDITNEEWGSGINIQWTWFETNKFKIKMQRLAPKFKFNYFDQMADHVYGVWDTATTDGDRDFATVIGDAMTQDVVKDINAAELFLMNWKNSLGRYPFANAQFRIVAPYSAWWWLDQAFRSARQDLNATHFFRQPNITFTNKLTQLGGDENNIYLFVENWEQNVLTTRIPLSAHGPVDDIDVFASKMSYRGAYGVNLDSNSFMTLQFAPDNASFRTRGVQHIYDTTPVVETP